MNGAQDVSRYSAQTPVLGETAGLCTWTASSLFRYTPARLQVRGDSVTSGLSPPKKSDGLRPQACAGALKKAEKKGKFTNVVFLDIMQIYTSDPL